MPATTLIYTGGVQDYVVPAGVTSLQVECWGAAGGPAGAGGAVGGLGGYAKGNLAVTPGETLKCYVGGVGTNGTAGGYNGGGASVSSGSGGTGGGASDVRQGGTALANRKIVAGGGGGGGSQSSAANGGAGGGTTGVNGSPGFDNPSGYGRGGTQAAGGAGGTGGNGGSSAGTLGVGATNGGTNNIGGAGGGGYYGGGSGASGSVGAAGGGGGGSSYVGGVTLTTTTAAQRAGSGQIVITALNANPNAPGALSPAGGAIIDRTIAQRFSWTFSDPDAGDTQSKYDLQYRLVGAGSWTTVTATTPNAFSDFAASALTAGDYEWQARNYDAQGLVSPWSSSAFFTAATPPGAPTITAPLSGGTVGNDPSLVSWSAPTQASYQLRKLADLAGSPDTGTIYYDSGEVVDAAARSQSLPFPVNNRWEHVQVRIKAGGLWSPWSSVRVDVSYTPPGTPTLVVTPSDAAASIDVAIANVDPPAVTNDLYRRVAGDGTGIRIATGLALNSHYQDRTVASGVDYEYSARAVAANGTSATGDWTS
jgi:hypothetical protein